MSDPTSAPAAICALFSVNLVPVQPIGQPTVNKIINVVGVSIIDALSKVNTAYHGAEIRGINKGANIDIP